MGDGTVVSRRLLGTAAPPVPPVAVPPLPAALRPDGAQPDARKGHRQHNISRPEGIVCAHTGPLVHRRLRAAATERAVASHLPGDERPVCGVCGYCEQDCAQQWQGECMRIPVP